MALTISIEGKGVIANADGYTDTATSGSTWGEDGTGADAFTSDNVIYGSSSFAGAYSNKAGFQYFDIGAGNELDFTTGGTEEGQFIWQWVSMPQINGLRTLAQNGLALRVGSSLTDYVDFTVAGSDDSDGWLGGWKCFVLDPTLTPTSSSGTPDLSAVRYIGVYVYTTKVTRGDNIFQSQISVGKGLRITGTSTDAWTEVANYCNDFANRAYGNVYEKSGIYFAQGSFFIGDSTQTADTSFAALNSILAFEKCRYWTGTAWTSTYPTDAVGFVTEDNATYQTDWIDGAIVSGTETGRNGSTVIGNPYQDVYFDFSGSSNNTNSTVEFYGTRIREATGGITFHASANSLWYGGAIGASGQLVPNGGAKFRNMVIYDFTGATTEAAFLFENGVNISNCQFINNEYAIEVDTNFSPVFNYLNFIGNTYDVNNTSGVSIAVTTNNSNPSTYFGSPVTFSSAFIHRLIGLAENTEVTYVDTLTSGVLYHLENAPASGISEYTHDGTETVDILIHHIDYKPEVSNIYDLQLPAQNAEIKIQQEPDTNYYNP